YNPWTPTPGKHLLTVTPFSGPNLTGLQGASASLTFWVIDQSSPTSVDINFQPEGIPTVRGTKSDIGRTLALRGNGLTYGWRRDNTANMFDRNLTADQRLDSGGAITGSQTWDIGVKNGTYNVFVLEGDPGNPTGNYGINVEGVLAVHGAPTARHPWIGGGVTVTVTDNTITLSVAPAS